MSQDSLSMKDRIARDMVAFMVGDTIDAKARQCCPNCGALPELQSWTCHHTEDGAPFQAYQQECEECGLAGPIRASEVEATIDWNSLRSVEGENDRCSECGRMKLPIEVQRLFDKAAEEIETLCVGARVAHDVAIKDALVRLLWVAIAISEDQDVLVEGED